MGTDTGDAGNDRNDTAEEAALIPVPGGLVSIEKFLIAG
jgi:hypothetical protein